MKLSVSHKDITMVRFEINGSIVEHKKTDQLYIININDSCDIEVFFEPWGIKPLIRIDDHLIDYYLANVMQFEHMVKFTWADDFYDSYQDRNIKAKIDYLGITMQEEVDFFIGINNSNKDIVDQIKKYLK